MPRGDVKKLCVTTEIEKWYNARDNVFGFVFLEYEIQNEITPNFKN